jgi:hypothetical protein
MLVPRIALLLALGAACLARPALAQDGGVDAGELGAGELDAGELDAGELDAGELDGELDAGPNCEPRCEGDELLFCDDGALVALDCQELEGRCGLLSDEWGFDCLVPEGAPCEPGYADGLSRCEGSAQAALCCIESECAAPPAGTGSCRVFLPPAPSRPAIADPRGPAGAQPGCLESCPGLGGGAPPGPQQPGGGGFPFLALLLGLGALRWRR